MGCLLHHPEKRGASEQGGRNHPTRSRRCGENDLVEARLAELRENPRLLERTYDLQHLREIHRFLFQDLYDWAGDLRTVGMSKGGGDSFAPPAHIWRPMEYVHQEVNRTRLLRDCPPDGLVLVVADLYDYVNFAHPFREGNGRAQREFFDQLLAESDHGLNWTLIDKAQLHDACHAARNASDRSGLIGIFQAILDHDPAY